MFKYPSRSNVLLVVDLYLEGRGPRWWMAVDLAAWHLSAVSYSRELLFLYLKH